MESAKNAISNFMSGDGAHKTSVHQDQRDAVTEEHVQPHRHEEVTTAIDKEVHQHHHRTIVQPIQHTETLPEKHTHNALPVEHKTVHHSSNDPETTRDTLAADQAQYQSTSTTHDHTHSTSAAPTLAGEHVHHHVHEHIQPVIQRHVAAPEVVHTTVPIHETHHLETVHHDSKILPAKTMDEFKTANAGLISKTEGGVEKLLGKHEERKIGQYEGCGTDYVEKGVKDGKIIGSEHSHKHLADPTGTAATAAAAAAMSAKSGSHTDHTGATTADTTADPTRGNNLGMTRDSGAIGSEPITRESGALGTGSTTRDSGILGNEPTTTRDSGILGGQTTTRGDNIARDDNLAREGNIAPAQDTTRGEKIETLKETAKVKAADKAVSSDTPAGTTHDSSKVSDSARAQAAAERGGAPVDTTHDTTRDSTKISESAEAQVAAERGGLNKHKDDEYTTSGERKSLDTGKYDISSRVPRDPTVSDKDKGLHYDEEEKKRISLKDKLNPFKDADGDGKKGIFS